MCTLRTHISKIHHNIPLSKWSILLSYFLKHFSLLQVSLWHGFQALRIAPFMSFFEILDFTCFIKPRPKLQSQTAALFFFFFFHKNRRKRENLRVMIVSLMWEEWAIESNNFTKIISRQGCKNEQVEFDLIVTRVLLSSTHWLFVFLW